MRAGRSTVDLMQIDLLVVPNCPNHSDALTRVHAALATLDVDDVAVRTREVVDLAQAEALGMHGSPTILLDGIDPFAVQDSAASISCRLYRSTTGLSGCPTIDELVEAINATAS